MTCLAMPVPPMSSDADMDLRIVDDVVKVFREDTGQRPCASACSGSREQTRTSSDIDAVMTQEIFLVVVQNIDAATTNGTGSNQADFNCHVIHSIQNRVSRDYTY